MFHPLEFISGFQKLILLFVPFESRMTRRLRALVTLHQDDARTSMTEVRETYRRRRDCLLERRVQPKDAAVAESFSLGAVCALRSVWTSRGRKVTEFEGSARADGLVRRSEQACPGTGYLMHSPVSRPSHGRVVSCS